MSVDFIGVPVAPARPVIGTPHPALERQQLFADQRRELLPRAQATGQRLASALYVVLNQHLPATVTSEAGQVHLSCAECRPDGREPAEQFPCPTAEQALWALVAALPRPPHG